MKNETQQIRVVEENILIARRVPPGDKWRLVANEPDGPLHKNLTENVNRSFEHKTKEFNKQIIKPIW